MAPPIAGSKKMALFGGRPPRLMDNRSSSPGGGGGTRGTVCRHWKMGRCRHGSSCSFDHFEDSRERHAKYSVHPYGKPPTSTAHRDETSYHHSSSSSWKHKDWNADLEGHSYSNGKGRSGMCSSLVVIPPPSQMPSDNSSSGFRTDLCRYRNSGRCPLGSSCPDAHCVEELLPGKFTETEIRALAKCADSGRRSSRYTPDGAVELNKSAPECNGTTPWATSIHHRGTDSTTPVCSLWREGNCLDGNNCPYLHEGTTEVPMTPDWNSGDLGLRDSSGGGGGGSWSYGVEEVREAEGGGEWRQQHRGGSPPDTWRGRGDRSHNSRSRDYTRDYSPCRAPIVLGCAVNSSNNSSSSHNNDYPSGSAAVGHSYGSSSSTRHSIRSKPSYWPGRTSQDRPSGSSHWPPPSTRESQYGPQDIPLNSRSSNHYSQRLSVAPHYRSNHNHTPRDMDRSAHLDSVYLESRNRSGSTSAMHHPPIVHRVKRVATETIHSQDSKKRIPCKFWDIGDCYLGSKCPYSHDGERNNITSKGEHLTTVKSENISGGKKSVCRHWLKGDCWRGAECQFAHGDNELDAAAI